ncbi:ankyrin 2,3/unc44, putative [Babesia caballi]|uniref:Ankyrin 2,3/unc44, putative n=1 Tax=Babesia caballi TaxID=5871 RepID=A0AAV4LN58_BABCB|nr:ankyrin 2,3/unc44, putative [Babesia caballi]
MSPGSHRTDFSNGFVFSLVSSVAGVSSIGLKDSLRPPNLCLAASKGFELSLGSSVAGVSSIGLKDSLGPPNLCLAASKGFELSLGSSLFRGDSVLGLEVSLSPPNLCLAASKGFELSLGSSLFRGDSVLGLEVSLSPPNLCLAASKGFELSLGSSLFRGDSVLGLEVSLSPPNLCLAASKGFELSLGSSLFRGDSVLGLEVSLSPPNLCLAASKGFELSLGSSLFCDSPVESEGFALATAISSIFCSLDSRLPNDLTLLEKLDPALVSLVLNLAPPLSIDGMSPKFVTFVWGVTALFPLSALPGVGVTGLRWKGTWELFDDDSLLLGVPTTVFSVFSGSGCGGSSLFALSVTGFDGLANTGLSGVLAGGGVEVDLPVLVMMYLFFELHLVRSAVAEVDGKAAVEGRRAQNLLHLGVRRHFDGVVADLDGSNGPFHAILDEVTRDALEFSVHFKARVELPGREVKSDQGGLRGHRQSRLREAAADQKGAEHQLDTV